MATTCRRSKTGSGRTERRRHVTASGCVLALNGGSSSLKFAVFPMEGETPLLQGKAERIGLKDSSLRITDGAGRQLADERRQFADHAAALKRVLEFVRG